MHIVMLYRAAAPESGQEPDWMPHIAFPSEELAALWVRRHFRDVVPAEGTLPPYWGRQGVGLWWKLVPGPELFTGVT